MRSTKTEEMNSSNEEDERSPSMNVMDLLSSPRVGKDLDKEVLSSEEIEKRLFTLRYGKNVTIDERNRFEKIFREYIHVFALSYKDLKEVTLEQHRIELEKGAKPIQQTKATICESSNC